MTLVDKVCDCLIQLREGPMSCGDLARRLRLPKSSVHGMLVVLLDRGLVERLRPPQKFATGSPPFRYWLADQWSDARFNGAPKRGDGLAKQPAVVARAETGKIVAGCAASTDPS